MSIIISTLFDTEWGIIIIGMFLLGAILIEIFGNKPKI